MEDDFYYLLLNPTSSWLPIHYVPFLIGPYLKVELFHPGKQIVSSWKGLVLKRDAKHFRKTQLFFSINFDYLKINNVKQPKHATLTISVNIQFQCNLDVSRDKYIECLIQNYNKNLLVWRLYRNVWQQLFKLNGTLFVANIWMLQHWKIVEMFLNYFSFSKNKMVC